MKTIEHGKIIFGVTVPEGEAENVLRRAHNIRSALSTVKYAAAELKGKYLPQDPIAEKKSKQLDAAIATLEANLVLLAELLEVSVES